MNADWFREIVGRSRESLDVGGLAADVERAPGLFRWCLDEDIRRRLARYYAEQGLEASAQWIGQRPPLPELTGACWVVFVPNSGAPLLAGAIVLPLVWRCGPHDPRLPTALAESGDQIRNLLAEELDELREPWGLQMAPVDDLHRLDLRWMKVRPESGGAALAAGLIAAVRGGTADPRVWATGKWDPETGRWHVAAESLPAKLRLARDYGVQRLFVPPGSAELTEQLAQDQQPPLTVLKLRDTGGRTRPAGNRLYVAVRPYLYSWMPEPTAEDDWDFRKNYFLEALHDRRDRQAVADFYITRLLDQLVRDRRRDWLGQSERLSQWQPTHFVSIYSHSFELVHLGTQLFRPRCCLLIHTENFREGARRLAAQLRSPAMSCLPQPVTDRPAMVEEIERAVLRFLGDADPGRVLFDLTPGKRLMSLTLQGAAPAGSRLLCWWHDTDPQWRRVIPGSEYPLVWEMSAERRMTPLLVRNPPAGDAARRGVSGRGNGGA